MVVDRNSTFTQFNTTEEKTSYKMLKFKDDFEFFSSQIFTGE
jgi:hypothetical protein